MPKQTINTNNCGIVLSKEPAMHHTHTHRHWSKRLEGPSRLLLGLMMLAAWIALALPTSPAHAAAATCPNAELRALNNSSGLPDCRAYEMVTSPYKQGFAVQKQSYGDDGAVGYTSAGSFADNPYGSLGNQYVARRSETGWKSISMNPPGEQWVFQPGDGASGALSGDLRSSLWMLRPRSGPDERWADHPDREGVYLRRPDGVFSMIAPNPGTNNLRVWATTPDLSHVVLAGNYSAPTPNLYEVIDGDQVLRPIGVDNTGEPLPGGAAGGMCSLGMSEDGRVIFFALDYFSCYGPFARVGGARTFDLAASQCTRGAGDPGGICNADALVNQVGFASDGSRAVMTTTQQLVNGDTDQTNDVYVCEIPAATVAAEFPTNNCPNLRQLSTGAPGGADVENVVRVSEDGSHVYFVAHAVLAANHGANDQVAVAGAHNLYVWQTDAGHPEGRTRFVARLINPGDVGDKSTSSTQVTPDGRYLLVNTRDPLVTSGAGADTDSAADVYRYDAQTGQWLRLSTDASGSGGNAEDETLVMFYSAMTSDGHTVVFITPEALAPADSNSELDVYAWHQGQVSLISLDGHLSRDDYGAPGITASGADIFFKTTSQVTAADSDTNPDVYTARVGGGFDLRERGPCENEGCLGTPSAPPGLSSGADGLGGQGDVQEPAPRLTLRAISAAQRRSLAQTGRVTVTVTASKPGTVAARVTTTIDGRSSNGAAVRETMAEAGSAQLTLRLSKKARARLSAKRRLSVRVVISHSKFALPRSESLRLSLAAKANKKARTGSSVARDSVVKGGRS
jgi:hypothetical protein